MSGDPRRDAAAEALAEWVWPPNDTVDVYADVARAVLAKVDAVDPLRQPARRKSRLERVGEVMATGGLSLLGQAESDTGEPT